MADAHHHHQTTPPPPSRMGLRHAGGEIVEVQGGHIVRSTGRKDRHSKVCTAKGPRDRRVRLSAHTAIQFYDVQDRLGYDRPSKAVDWLIKKAKAAIDELEELPAWTPTSGWAAANSNSEHAGSSSSLRRGTHSTTTMAMSVDDIPNQQHQHMLEMGNGNNQNPSENTTNNSSSFLPPSLDSDAIADTIKSFFPMGGSSAVGNTNSSAMQFQGFPLPDLLSRTGSHSQDLRLSLQSFDDPILLHHHHHHHHSQQHRHHQQSQQQNQSAQHQADLFAATTGMVFDAGSWSEHQRMIGWNAGSDSGSGGGGGAGGGFVFNSQPLLQPLLFGHQNNNQFVSSQRGPLQSSNTPSIRAWIDPASFSDHHQHQNLPVYHPSSFGGFSGFRIPARIQGEEEEHDGISDKPSSASSDSRH